MEKKRILSGIQPSGISTLGNYVGALRNWVKLQVDDRSCFYCVANMHAITVRQNPDELRSRTLDTAAILLACGVDPNRSALFVQSEVHEHAELSWVLNCYTYLGELNRMTQFKDKSSKHSDNINAGLLTYPVLMAADILLYRAHYVPVGEDQKQHLEIARDIAERFNKVYGDVFVIPEPLVPKVGGRIMSLQDPTKKMSKSDPNPASYITVTDEPSAIMKKFKRAVTDSEGRIAYNENQPGVANLLSIYSTFTGMTIEESLAHFDGMGYGTLKTAVAEAVIDGLALVREEFRRIRDDKAYLREVLSRGREQAAEVAARTIADVYGRIGLGAFFD
ncbi:MAG: tryptophan--tRNA ligase [Clostridia bacterium]|nr:tryptophan--tRNA ligase [Clostridia bacterium]